MSQTNGHYTSAMEIACLPADDPLRVQLHENLRAAGGAELSHLEQELELTDRLRGALVDVQPSGGDEALAGRLLVVAATEPRHASGGARPGKIWRIAAAVAIGIGLLGAGTYYFWPRPEAVLAVVQIDPQVEKTIVESAVKNHESTKPLEIASGDVDAVSKALSARGMDFPVLMLKTNGTIKLEGGGTCDIGKAPAVYTRWSGNGMQYTLYEFNGPDAGAPRDFLARSEQPKELWHDDKQYRVMVWPGAGGKCCWALVLEKNDAANPFILFDYKTSS